MISESFFFFLGAQVIASDRKTNISLLSLRYIELELLLTINILHFTGLQDVSASIFLSLNINCFLMTYKTVNNKISPSSDSIEMTFYEPKGWCNTIKTQHRS